MAGLLDHGLVGSSVNDEHQSVVVFDGLDSAFGGKGVLNDGVLVEGLLLLDALSCVFGLSVKSESLGSSESGFCPDLVLSNGVRTLLH